MENPRQGFQRWKQTQPISERKKKCGCLTLRAREFVGSARAESFREPTRTSVCGAKRRIFPLRCSFWEAETTHMEESIFIAWNLKRQISLLRRKIQKMPKRPKSPKRRKEIHIYAS